MFEFSDGFQIFWLIRMRMFLVNLLVNSIFQLKEFWIKETPLHSYSKELQFWMKEGGGGSTIARGVVQLRMH